MSKIYPIVVIKKTTIISGGAANVTAVVKPGIKVSTGPIAMRSPAVIKAGVKVSQGPIKLTPATTKPGIAVSLRPVTGATIAKPLVNAGVKVSMGQFRTVAPAATDKGGFKVIRHVFTLTRRNGAVTVTQTGVVGSGFANPANAQGIHDGVFAVLTGSVAAAQAGTLTGTYTDPDSTKALFTISTVKCYLYWKVATDPLAGAIVARAWKTTNLAQVNFAANSVGAADHSVGPETFDITAAIAGSWANLNGFTTIYTGSTPIASTAIISLDGIELEIVTDALVTAQ